MDNEKPEINPSILWEEGLFDALIEASSKMPEPVKSFALRRAVEETEYRVKTSGRDVVKSDDLLSTMKVAVSRSMYSTLKRVLKKRSLLDKGRTGNG